MYCIVKSLKKKSSFVAVMKKVFTISIAFLYLAVTSGLALEIHHCMGKIADISLLPSPVERCGSCGMKKGANECCKDELKLVKLQNAHKLIPADYQLHVPVAVINHHYFLTDHHQGAQLNVIDNSNNHSPPDCSPVSLCIINCVYRI